MLNGENDQKSSAKSALQTSSGQSTPYIKHPLQSKWTLWYYTPDKNKHWEECQHKIATFDSVEDFWGLFNNLQPASELKNGCDYSVFKNGIRPMWEDPQNIKGGRWIINVGRQRQTPIDLDDGWLEVLMFLIGESFNYTDDVCGVVLNNRGYGHKIGIWTSVKDERKVMSIGSDLKTSLKLPQTPTLLFESHNQYGKAASKTLFKV